jgi:hypothetical protein
MKNKGFAALLLSFLLLFTMSCNLLNLISGKSDSSSASGDQEEVQSTDSDSKLPDQVLYFVSLPVDVTDDTGNFKVISARALETTNNWVIVAILENISTDPTAVVASIDFKADVINVNNDSVGGNSSTADYLACIPGRKCVITVYPGNWEGKADHFTLELLKGITPTYGDEFKAMLTGGQVPDPILPFDATPYQEKAEKYLLQQVKFTTTDVTIKNPGTAPTKPLALFGVYYDKKGQIIGIAGAPVQDPIEPGGEVSLSMDSALYLTGEPAQAEYYLVMDGYNLEQYFIH